MKLAQLIHDLSQRLKALFKTERSLSFNLEMAWTRLRPLALPVLAITTVVLGVIFGLLSTRFSWQVIALALAGLAVVISTLSRPEFVILLMLVASSSIYDLSQIPTIHVGFSFSAIELCLIFLLGLVVAQALGNKKAPYVKTPLDLPIALFFLASFISLVNSVINLGTDVDLMEYQWRILFNYLAFFTVTNLVRTRRQLMTLVVSMFVVATIVAVLMIAQQAVGTSVVLLPGRVETAAVEDASFSGVTRILPPGQSLILIMFMPAFILFVTRERLDRVGWLLLIVIVFLFIALAFTFNRRMWVGVAISIVAVFFLSTKDQRKNLFIFLCALVVFSAIAIPLLSASSPKLGDIFNALYIRGISLFSGDEVQYSSSWQWRLMENEYAADAIRQHPLFGIGPGNDYRPRIRLGGDPNTGYMHNAYYFILLDLGLAGFVPFVWFSALFLLRGFRLWPTIQDRAFMAVVLGLGLSYITILITCVAAPAFMEWYWTPVIGVMLGINEVIYRLDREAVVYG